MLKRIKGLAKRAKLSKMTNDMKVQVLSEQAVGLLESFKKTHDELEDINNQLQQVIDEETQKAIEIERNRDKAFDEMEMNKKLQAKLAEFIR
ncbi:hypothetical protein ABE137_12365 [Brevibacillus laterosporus]|uniref:hypothetical protein n=1 Tax=Brevibacillus phage Sundance TaxID=1691958 RepID=UPI0006BD62F3|nr:hypothetical protein AVT09_gp150 [Brevibacillus phage Sundance]ALA47966.1 hypothetical protein SUNDANCE_150 [Brevibacillus phage Sundance]